MPDETATSGFREELTPGEWATVARALLGFSNRKILPLLRERMQGHSYEDAEDVLMQVLEIVMRGLMSADAIVFSKFLEADDPPLGRDGMLESLRAMTRSKDQKLPKWLERRCLDVARSRARNFNRSVNRRLRVELFDVSERPDPLVPAPDPIDDHPSPYEALDHREEIECRSILLATAAERLFKQGTKSQRLFVEWLARAQCGEQRGFLNKLTKSERRLIEKVHQKLKDEMSALQGDVSTQKINFAPKAVPPINDDVEFTITSPEALPVGNSSIVDVWVHLSSQRHKILPLAAKVRDEGLRIAGSKGPVAVARGTELAIQLCVPGCDVRPVEDVVVWNGMITNATFAVTLPNETESETLACEAIVRIRGLQIARVAFVLYIGMNRGPVKVVSSRLHRHRRAFASYASKDRNSVLARIQGMQKETPDIDVFVDVARLKSGQRWPVVLEREILTSDVLYLFWSKAASKSKWVEKEWRLAYTKRGVDFIDPVPLEPPDKVPPPDELADLHFNDWVLAFMRGQSSGNLGRRKRR